MRRNAIAAMSLLIASCGCGDARLVRRARLSSITCLPFAIEVVRGVQTLNELRGRVLAVGDGPVPGADVLVRIVGSDAESAQTVTSESGEFAFPNLKPAAYQVEVCREGFNASVHFVRILPAHDRHALQIVLHPST